jgi:outer membrane putative beta-barrel porin/alpha-amylase
MSKAALIIALAALASPAAVQAQEGLAFLIPNLYGPGGLVVDSEARLPDGSTHSAHFNSAFQAGFTQFNVSLASQLASVPPPSPASGFTYELDTTLGVFKRSTQSFGPILADRAETIGRKKASFGLNYQSFHFDTLEGIDLRHVPAVFTHDNPDAGGRSDVVATDNSIDLRVSQLISYFSYGLTDRVDISVALPVVNVDLGVVSDATLRRIGTQTSPATHFFRDSAGGFSTQKTFASSRSASGIGDVIARVKIQPFKSGVSGFALGAEGRFPTGDEYNLLGSGAFGVKPFVVFSLSRNLLSPHINLGYQWNGDSVLAGNVLTGEKRSLPDQFLYVAGMDIAVSPWMTLTLDVIGRRVLKSPRVETETFSALDGTSTFPSTHFVQDADFNVTNGAAGLKINAAGRLLFDLNVVFKMDEAGLRERITPMFGIEYSF